MLERKVWVAPRNRPLYPNLYCWLVGPPGIGKSRIIQEGVKPFFRLLSGASEPHIAPKNVSQASLIDYLNEEGKRIVLVQPPPALEYHSAYVMADELSQFIPEWKPEMVAGLTSYWDGLDYTEWKRGGTLRVHMERVCLNMIAGMTPVNLQGPKSGGLIPEAAWDGGLMSRVILIYAKDRKLTNILKVEPDLGLPQDMVDDFHYIDGLHGELGWDEDWADAFTAWREGQEAGDKSAKGPSHPKLVHYCTRRAPMLFKLSTIACIDRGMGQIMNLEDWNRAYGWLKEAEMVMAEAFDASGGGPDSKVQDELAYYVLAQYKKNGNKPVSEALVLLRAGKLMAPSYVQITIELMVNQGRIKETLIDQKTGQRRFVPGGGATSQ